MKQRMACLAHRHPDGRGAAWRKYLQAAESFLKAFPGTHTFYLDGQPIEMEAYNINGNNYVMLRDESARPSASMSTGAMGSISTPPRPIPDPPLQISP